MDCERARFDALWLHFGEFGSMYRSIISLKVLITFRSRGTDIFGYSSIEVSHWLPIQNGQLRFFVLGGFANGVPVPSLQAMYIRFLFLDFVLLYSSDRFSPGSQSFETHFLLVYS